MRLTSVLKGAHFGNLAYIRGLITYRISPFEQYAFAGFTHAIGRTAYRIRNCIFKSGPPFAAYFLIRTEVEKRHAALSRKNPEDFVNDK
ncbi:hypothetical protein O3M35_006169 [Rhynocoris fuscipes]|uniref:Cytochrome b-c1 complex subunit 8 n=1 Tax=Rhynocoris fuscipes TaxID=488301 RepID=A0AAW1DI85_9HEMI